ncbi:MAG: T9SS type A sorting domain-containing protein [Bacteroidota bacterium]
MKNFFILFYFLFFYSEFASAARYDSTMVVLNYYDDEECSYRYYAQRTFSIVTDHDSTIRVLYFPDWQLLQSENVSWTKYYLDDHRIPYLKEDSSSRTLLSYIDFTYDSLGRITNELHQFWDTISGGWIYNFRISRNFDSFGNISYELNERYDTASVSWVVLNDLLHMFNVNNRHISTTYKTYNLGIQDGGYFDSLSYSLSGGIVFSMHQQWISNSWINISMDNYFRNANDNDTLVMHYSGDSTAWDTTFRNIKSFNGLFQLVTDTMQSWDGNSWINNTLIECEYAGNGKIQRKKNYEFVNNNWEYDTQKYCEYDGMDSLSMEMFLEGNLSSWDTINRIIYFYANYYPVNITISNESWFGPDTWCGDIEHSQYDSAGRILSASQHWCGGGGMSGASQYYMYDNNGFMIFKHTEHCTMGGFGSYYDIFYYHQLVTMPSVVADTPCLGDTITISFQVQGGIPPWQFHWSSLNYIPDTTSLSNAIIISQNAPIIFVATDSLGNISVDTINLNISPVLHLGNDLGFCNNETVILNTGYGNSSYTYLWQDGSSDSVFTVNSQGTYWVWVSDTAGCQVSDTITIEYFTPPMINIGADTSLCGDEIFIHAGPLFSDYHWVDNSTDSVLLVTASGNYWVEVTDSNGCTAADTVGISLFPTPVVAFGNDTTLCHDETMILHAGTQFVIYEWQDHSMDSNFIASVQSAGADTQIYFVTVIDSNGCVSSDSITIFFDVCSGIEEGSFSFVKVFPNPVMRNSEVIVESTVKEYQFKLLDINGRILQGCVAGKPGGKIFFESPGPGVYFYEITFAPQHRFIGKLVVF